MNGERLTYRELADGLGISKTAAHKRARRGMPVDSLAAARAWSARHCDVVRSQPLSMEPMEDEAPRDEDLDEYRRARADRERIRADREQLELANLRGKLIDVEEASRLAFTVFRGLRDAFENIAPRIKDELAAEADAFRVEQILTREIGAVLAGFDVEAAVREKDGDDDDEA